MNYSLRILMAKHFLICLSVPSPHCTNIFSKVSSSFNQNVVVPSISFKTAVFNLNIFIFHYWILSSVPHCSRELGLKISSMIKHIQFYTALQEGKKKDLLLFHRSFTQNSYLISIEIFLLKTNAIRCPLPLSTFLFCAIVSISFDFRI